MWNPISHVPDADDTSIVLEFPEQVVKAILWSNLGDTIHDPDILKVESAEDAAGPWSEVTVLDMGSLRGSSEVSAIPIPPVQAHFIRLSPGGIKWQSTIRMIGLCSTEDCQPPPASEEGPLPDSTTAPLSPPPSRGDPCCETHCADFVPPAGENGRRRLLAEPECDCDSCPKLPGFLVSYYKIGDDVDALEQAFSSIGSPVASGFSLDVDYDEKAFSQIAADFPHDHFAARWTGLMQVDTGGSYNFYLKSDDGSKLFVNGELVVDNDGLHGMENTAEGSLELQPGFFTVRVDYFEKDGEQGIKLRYAGPDTLGQQVLLRGLHTGTAPATAPTPPDIMHRGFVAKYYKLSDRVTSMPSLLGLEPSFLGVALDVTRAECPSPALDSVADRSSAFSLAASK
jgi:hypothetical protein